MRKQIRRWQEVSAYDRAAVEKRDIPKNDSEVELTEKELAMVHGAGYGAAPVSLTCLQSLLLGESHCGTQSLGEDYVYATVGKDAR